MRFRLVMAIAALPWGAAVAQETNINDLLSVRSGSYSMNVGVIGTIAAGTSTARDIEGGTQLGGHDPNQRGFTLQSFEAHFNGAVDPYFRGNANITLGIDSGGETFVELEEAFAETISL